MSLILRGEIARRLTIPEMDGNFLYLEDLALSVVGATGAQGATGASGSITTVLVTTYLPGATGPQGEPGIPGEQGLQGVPGLGVYIVGQLGNTGSLPATASNGTSYIISDDVYIYGTNSWINAGPIIGPAGATGTPGSTGPMGPAGGPRGATGATGPQGITGASGSITTVLVTTYLPGATGPQGEPGIPGEQGLQGIPGLGVYIVGQLGDTASLPATASNGTSYIITDDVYIYGTNSWINAGPIVGPAGATGSPGATGAMGPAGGPRGATGPTGPSTALYLLEAYAEVTYTLPGTFTEDVCRYGTVSNTVNLSSGWFDTSTYTFTPQKAGYWEITATYDIYRNTEAAMIIKKNNVLVSSAGSFGAVAQQITKIVYLNGSTDFINIFNVGGSSNSRDQFASRSWFQARWIGE
jgi:hypothetical protein